MRRKDFGQYCGLARALDLVGERWALLIVRELLARPARYTDLTASLPGIPTNALTARLKELQQAGLIEQRLAPAGQRGVVYALTAEGQELQDALLTLAVWGNRHLENARPGKIVPPSSLVMAMRATFKPDNVEGIVAKWEIHTAGVILHVAIADGEIVSGVGPGSEDPDLVITLRGDEVPTFQKLIETIRSGAAELDGDESLAPTFVSAFF